MSNPSKYIQNVAEFVCLLIYIISICLIAYPRCVWVCLSVNTYVSICLIVYPSCVCVCLFVSIYLSICLIVYPRCVCFLSVNTSVCLIVYISVLSLYFFRGGFRQLFGSLVLFSVDLGIKPCQLMYVIRSSLHLAFCTRFVHIFNFGIMILPVFALHMYCPSVLLKQKNLLNKNF